MFKTLSINKTITVLLLLFIFFYFYKLNINPLYRDELANGLDAYTLGINGTNIYGEKYPFLFNLHGTDLLEPMFKYMLIPFINVFGRTANGVRMLSVTIATFTILLTGLLSFELFKKKKIAIISMLFLAVSPWHFVFSRLGFRAILVPFLFTLATYLFFKAKDKPVFFPLSCLVFGLTTWSYAVTRLTLPLFIILLIIIFFKQIIKINKFDLFAGILILILTVFPIFMITISNRTFNSRTEKVTILNSDKATETISKNIKSYFNYRYVFFNGDANKRHSILGVGLENPITIIFFLIAIFLSFKNKTNRKIISFLLGWMLIGLFPGFVTEPNHSLRTIGVLPSIQILAGFGVYQFVKSINKYQDLIFKSIIGLSALYGIYFIFMYFGPNVKYASKMFVAGLDEVVIYANTNYPEEKIVYGATIRHPYAYQLFYGQSYTDTDIPYIKEFVTRQCNVGTGLKSCYKHEEFRDRDYVYIEKANSLEGLDELGNVVFVSKVLNGEDLYAVIK